MGQYNRIANQILTLDIFPERFRIMESEPESVFRELVLLLQIDFTIYDTTIDALYYTQALPDGKKILPSPKGKHLFGVVTMNERGQIVIPKKARDVMGFGPSEELLVLGDEASGIALMKVDLFEKQMQTALNSMK